MVVGGWAPGEGIYTESRSMTAVAELAERWEGIELPAAAARRAHAVLDRLGSSESGLVPEEASVRLAAVGPNAVLSHGAARPLQVLWRQLRNPLLILLARAAIVSVLVRERADAGIILAIVCLSVGLGFVNEYRSEKAVEELHCGYNDVRPHRAAGRRPPRRRSMPGTRPVHPDRRSRSRLG